MKPELRIVKGAGQESWSAGLQPAFIGIFWGKPSVTRRSVSSTLPSNASVLRPIVKAGALYSEFSAA
jgi:hypothetical protein